MPSPIYLDFIARGIPNVERAFRDVRTVVARSETDTTRVVGAAARLKEREYAKLAREASRWQQQVVRGAEKAARDEVRATERAERNRQRIRDRSATMAGQLAAREVRETERAEQAKTRAVERAERERQRIRDRSASMAGRYAAQQVRQEQSVATKNAVARERVTNAVIGAGGSAVVNAAKTTSRAVLGVAGMYGQLGGGFSLTDSMSRESNLERSAALLANKAILPGGKRASTKDIMTKVKAASIATGTDSDKLLDAWSAYTEKTGDFKGGEGNLQFFGKVAKATGADLGQLATTAGILRVQNKNLDEKSMQRLMLDTIAAGRSGSVDMPELAAHAGAITKTSSSYAGSQEENQRKLLGLSQVGVRVGSVAEAATMLSNISGDASKHSAGISALLGKDTFNAKGQIAKGPDEFIADVLAKTGGNRQKIQGLGFGQRSLKMFDALLPTYNDAESKALAGGATKAGATKAARDAVMADMGQFTNAKLDPETIEQDFANVMKTSAEQVEASMRELRGVVGEQLVPEMVKLVPIARDLVPPLKSVLEGMISIAEWAAANPFAGFGTLVSGFFMKELIAAQIGSTVRNALNGGGGGGVPGAPGVSPGMPGASPGMGMGGTLAVGLGAATQLAFLGQRADLVANAVDAGESKSDKIAALVKGGKRDEAQAMIDQAKEDSSASNWAMAAINFAGRSAAYANPLAIAGQYAGDKVTEAVTGRGNMADEQVSRTVNAQTVASNAEAIMSSSEKVATALDAAANKIAGAAQNDARNKNMIDRN